MNHNLTNGAIAKIMSGAECNFPVFQILGFKKIPGQPNGSDRFRLNISDGVNSHTFAMLGTQLNHLIPDGSLENYSIVRADKYVCNIVTEKKVIILLELTVLERGSNVGSKIGKPTLFVDTNPQSLQAPAPATTNTNGNGVAQGQPSPRSFYGKSDAADNSRSKVVGVNPSNMPLMTITDLNPFNNKCAIRARVVSKSEMRKYSNAKGEGKIFNMNLLDETGEIRMTGFNNAVDVWYNTVEVGNVYVFRNFMVKNANTQFNKLGHSYELTMTNDTDIKAVLDEESASVPQVTYNFTKIADIEKCENNSFIDVLGVVKTRGDLVNLTSKAGKELQKRELTLVDMSNAEIGLTLWGSTAEEFLDDTNPILALKGAKVGDYMGKNLSANGLVVNPDIKEAHALRGWYDNIGKNETSRSLTQARGSSNTEWKFLREINRSNGQNSDKGDYFMTKVTVMSIRQENVCYMACPSLNCQKKVVDLGNGSYRCEKCSKEFNEYKWRLLISASFGDPTGLIWATCFQESGEIMLGYSAEIIGNLQRDSPAEFEVMIKKAVFQNYIAKFRSRLETYNGENRKKITVVDLHPLVHTEYARKLVNELKESGAV